MEDTYELYRDILRQPKVIFIPSPPLKRANNSNFFFYETEVHHESLEIIPELRFRHDIKASGHDTNAKFTLHYLKNRCDRRVFQLEIYSFEYPSHREPDGSVWYGPHLYYEGVSRRTTAKMDSIIGNRAYWLKRFFRHTNIILREREGVFQRDLL